MSAAEQRDKSRARTRRAKKRLRERNKGRKTSPARETQKVVRLPRTPYASGRGLIKVLKAATVAVACLFLLEACFVAAIKFLLIHSAGDYIAVAWEWARKAALTLFGAGVIQAILIGIGAAFDIGDQTREMLAMQRSAHGKPPPLEGVDEVAPEEEDGEPGDDAKSSDEEVAAEPDPEEGEEPPPLGSGD
jgi:hypothetical protein